MDDPLHGNASPSSPAVARLARLAVLATFGLVVAGGLVTSRDAGLAVPDWPLSFGTLNPPRWLQIVNVRTEHGHRLIAGIVALLTIALAVTARVQRERKAVQRIAAAAAALVLFQALLGGLRVLSLSLDLAMVHALTGQLFLCVTVGIATLTSPSWRTTLEEHPRRGERADVAVLFSFVLVQLVLGIVIRHLGAEARPLLRHSVFQAHAVLALAVVALAVRWRTIETASGRRCASHRATQLLALVLVQVGLGIATYFIIESMAHDRQASALESWLPTLHVTIGAGILASTARSMLHAFAHPSPALSSDLALARAREPIR
jgi:cytochrome c oxidase assembly protein subunit 15